MTNPFILSEKKLFSIEKLTAIAALFIGTIAISFAAIFIKWSEIELSANATVFNRLWIAALILGFWNNLNSFYLKQSNPESNQESVQNKPYTKSDCNSVNRANSPTLPRGKISTASLSTIL